MKNKIEILAVGNKGAKYNYVFPTQDGYELHVMDLKEVKAYETSDSIQIRISTVDSTSESSPMYGFDHVTFTIFLQDPTKKGSTVLPKQNSNTPQGFDWSYEVLLGGWNKALYSSEGATTQNFGKQILFAPDNTVEKNSKTIVMTIPKAEIGNPSSFNGWKVYVTTWDYDGMSNMFKPIMKVAEQDKFGGGDIDDAKTPYIMDDIEPIRVQLAPEEIINESVTIKKLKVEDIDFQIIDTHTHIGVLPGFDMTSEKFLHYIDNYKIGLTIISNLGGVEFGRDGKKMPNEFNLSQIEANTVVLELVKKRPNKIKALFWIRPHFQNLIKKH